VGSGSITFGVFVRMTNRRVRHVALACAATIALTACNATGSGGSDDSAGQAGQAESSSTPDPGVIVSANVGKGARNVPVDKLLTVSAKDGRLTKVVLSAPKAGPVPGRLTADGSSWTATERLEPGTTYTIRTQATGDNGPETSTRRFSTRPLTLDQQTYASVAPLQGETVGVGMPVVVTFDVPVTDKKTFEKHMKVSTTPAQPGSWYWLSDQEAHWRPKTYWRAGTKVSVDVDVNGVPAGNGIYGQEDRQVDFAIGDAHVYKVNAQTHQMKVFSNGKLLRTLPVTTGKPGFTTRSGVKVIMEKFETKRMRSETIGIARDSAEGYDLDDVKWAMRLTYSGEFIHAAPWSVGSQGHANVSHGCTGLSTANAAWLYSMTQRGDVVEYVGTDRGMEFSNGYGDWNLPFPEYKSGSALA